MKKILKTLMVSSILLGTFIACEDKDKAPFPEPGEGVEEKGVFLRKIQSRGIIDFDDLANSTWALTGELVSDEATLATVTNVEIKAVFYDNDSGLEADENESLLTPVLVSTTPLASFAKNDNGYPEAVITLNIGDVIDKIGVDQAENIDAGDSFGFQITINTTKRSFTDVNSTDDINLSFFTANFEYNEPAGCVQNDPAPGTWILDMQDSYSDGWNGGASLVVSVDGVNNSYLVTEAQGDVAQVKFDVPSGTKKIGFTFTKGTWDSEITYQVTDPNGVEVLNEGTSPFVGSVLCQAKYQNP